MKKLSLILALILVLGALLTACGELTITVGSNKKDEKSNTEKNGVSDVTNEDGGTKAVDKTDTKKGGETTKSAEDTAKSGGDTAKSDGDTAKSGGDTTKSGSDTTQQPDRMAGSIIGIWRRYTNHNTVIYLIFTSDGRGLRREVDESITYVRNGDQVTFSKEVFEFDSLWLIGNELWSDTEMSPDDFGFRRISGSGIVGKWLMTSYPHFMSRGFVYSGVNTIELTADGRVIQDSLDEMTFTINGNEIKLAWAGVYSYSGQYSFSADGKTLTVRNNGTDSYTLVSRDTSGY